MGDTNLPACRDNYMVTRAEKNLLDNALKCKALRNYIILESITQIEIVKISAIFATNGLLGYHIITRLIMLDFV